MLISREGVKVLEYEGYQISEFGDVYRNNKKLKPWNNGRGYLILRIKTKTKAVHRLVAELYVPNDFNYTEVNHKDGNKLNNHATNLEWCTRSENIKHGYDNSLRSATGVNNSRAKASEATVIEICEYIRDGVKPSEIRDIGYSYNLVRAIKNKKNWTHISCLYF